MLPLEMVLRRYCFGARDYLSPPRIIIIYDEGVREKGVVVVREVTRKRQTKTTDDNDDDAACYQDDGSVVIMLCVVSPLIFH